MRNQRRKQVMTLSILAVSVLVLSIGFAALSTVLRIDTAAHINPDSNLGVKFSTTSSAATTGVVKPTIYPSRESSTSSNSVTASDITVDGTTSLTGLSASFVTPGDYATYTVYAVNSGEFDAYLTGINLISNATCTAGVGTTNALVQEACEGISVSVSVAGETYTSATPVLNHLLTKGASEEIVVTIKYSETAKRADGPFTISFSPITLQYSTQDQSNIVTPAPQSQFATDSWEMIVANAKMGNTSMYNVGDTKEITLTGTGDLGQTLTVRVANNSTPEECNTPGFSQTACGFVIEFVDIITKHAMKSTSTNVGGWRDSEMRTYVNNDIFNALPTELRNNIIDTKVISGHGDTSGETNFETIDKLYLLSTHEVWEDVDGNTNMGIDYYDTAYYNTRQLDYYKSIGVTTSKYTGAIKEYSEGSSYWWLRSAGPGYANNFYNVNDYGYWTNVNAKSILGVAVAFRLGNQAETPEEPEEPEVTAFENDSWETIAQNVRNGNTSIYNVGDTKTITLTGTGDLGQTLTVRVANNSTPEECNTPGFSQTACGFVIEFEDIITNSVMNSTDTNVGGWRDSKMRTYVNNDIFNALPTELRNNIIDTKVISGHGNTSGETNFETIDKLYLLSTHEVYEDVDGNTNSGMDYYDTAYYNTRQLDYYKGLGVTTSKYSGTIKEFSGSASYWWLRSASSANAYSFYGVNNSGRWGNYRASVTNGVAVAFRLG